MRCFFKISIFVFLLWTASSSLFAEVVRVEIDRREPFAGGTPFENIGAYELLAGRVFFAVDPNLPENRRIVDLELAPRDSRGFVLFSADFVLLRPSDASKFRKSVLLEVLNRGKTEENGPFFDTPPGVDYILPELKQVKFNDAFPFDQGFTLAYLGWEVTPHSGTMHLEAPTVDVSGPLRSSFITNDRDASSLTHSLDGLNPGDCPTDVGSPKLRIILKRAFDDPGSDLSVGDWHFTTEKDPQTEKTECAIRAPGPLLADRLYEVVFKSLGKTPVAGLSFAALRDFASYLKRPGGPNSLLENHPAGRVIGYGYSQSARFLRSFLYGGFNTDEHGHRAFDGLFIASAGAGGGSFNQRFAQPDQAGTSVLCDLCPVDLFPFSDVVETDPITHQTDSVLGMERATHTIPKIVTTISSTEYWARFASLTYITVDGKQELPLDENERLYFTAGTPHGHAPFPPRKKVHGTVYEQYANYTFETPAFHALLLDLDDWVARGIEPPSSVYPHLAQLSTLSAVGFPNIPGVNFPAYMPRTWRMDFGPDFRKRGVSENEPPKLGPEYSILVPQVDVDGNDVGGLALPFLAVPLGTFTGWNYELPKTAWLNYLSGLRGSFIPFAATVQQRHALRDSRLSLEERYGSKQQFLDETRRVAEALVKRRLMLSRDLDAEAKRASEEWDFFHSSTPK